MVRSSGITLKKELGQHFLRDASVVQSMMKAVELDTGSSVMEIGCGDGFLTRSILQEPIARLWVFEIDAEWAKHVRTTIADIRLHVFEQNILDLDAHILQVHKPWTLLSNLPYQVTFPILHLIQRYRQLFVQGVVMVQEEVAQKIMKTSGRGYGFVSLFFQHYFVWKLLVKVPPTAFYPSPKVFSRLLYFKPRIDLPVIPDEEQFWSFIKVCFKSPRRTLRNNLKASAYHNDKIAEKFLDLRAQQLQMNDFLMLWDVIRTH